MRRPYFSGLYILLRFAKTILGASEHVGLSFGPSTRKARLPSLRIGSDDNQVQAGFGFGKPPAGLGFHQPLFAWNLSWFGPFSGKALTFLLVETSVHSPIVF